MDLQEQQRLYRVAQRMLSLCPGPDYSCWCASKWYVPRDSPVCGLVCPRTQAHAARPRLLTLTSGLNPDHVLMGDSDSDVGDGTQGPSMPSCTAWMLGYERRVSTAG